MISALVLAAGMSTRMGCAKLLMKLAGKPLLQHVIDNLEKSSVDKITVILGEEAGNVLKEVNFGNASIFINKHYNDGMSSSLKAGVQILGRDCNAFLVVLADQPFVESSIIDSIIDKYWETRGLLVVPAFEGVRGNPVLLDFSLKKEVLDVSGDEGARRVIQRHQIDVIEVEVNDPSVLMDIDTPTDYEEAKKKLK